VGVAPTQQNLPLVCWHSDLTPLSFSSSDGASGYSPRAMWSGDTYSFFKTTGYSPIGGGHLKNIVLGAYGSDANYIGIAGHNFGTEQITVRVLARTSGGWQIIVPDFMPVDDKAILKTFNNIFGLIEFRIELVLPVTCLGAKIAHVRMSKATTLERPVWVGETPAGMDVTISKIGSKSFSGKYLGSVITSRGNKFKIEQKNNTVNFVRSPELQRFFRHSYGCEQLSAAPPESFFYAWRPDTHPNEVLYCGATLSFDAPTNTQGTTSGGYMSWSMSGDAYL
jgi:hypothetical protein